MENLSYTEYKVWELPVRFFHWVNVLSVLALIFLGLTMLFKSELGITSIEAKITLKQVHVIIGYVFVVNLFFRLIWGFMGNKYVKWRSIMPNKNIGKELKQYRQSLQQNNPKQYLGHNPLGKLAVLIMLFTMIILALTGLIRAGTDIYYPPFGRFVSHYVAAPSVEPETLIPYDLTGTDPAKMQDVKDFKGIFGTIHVYGAYFLMFLIIVHVFFVVRSELNESPGIISAMFSGKKIIKGKVIDE